MLSFFFFVWAAHAARPHDFGVLEQDLATLKDPSGCAGAMTSVEEACSRSVFIAMASSVTSSLDCELQRTNNVVQIFAAFLQRADDAATAPAVELRSCSACYQRGQELPVARCPNLEGLRFAEFHGQALLVLGSGDKGLRYATGLLPPRSPEVFFTPKLHSRLQYLGHEPPIVLDLIRQRGDVQQGVCRAGPPLRNVLPANFSDFGARQVLWSPATESRSGDLTSKASTIAYSSQGEPMGTVTMTVNMSYASEALGELRLSPNVYALIADRRGRVAAMTSRAQRLIFNTTQRNPTGKRRCEDAEDCLWDPPTPLSLLDAKDSNFSGIDFEPVLGHVFDEKSDHLCSGGVKTSEIQVPDCGCEHLLVFCRLVGFPDWAIIVAAPVEELNAATFAVDKHDISGKVTNESFLEEIGLENTGRVPLPFTVTVSGQANTSGVVVEPSHGLLAPGAKIALAMKVDFSSFGHGITSGIITVQPNTSDDIGTCFRARSTTRFAFHRKRPASLLRAGGISASVICSVVFFIVVYRLVSSFLRKYYDDLSKERSTIDKALMATQELAFPMVLLTVDSFKKHKKFMAFEDVLNETLWLHTIQDIDNFLLQDLRNRKKAKKVIFMSHQWTAFDEPDHTGLQYKGMVEAVDTVMQKNGWENEETFVWLDYSCIPQRHRPSQTAAINSLTVYAAKVSAFIVVAPKVKHKDLDVFCDEESYKKRAWCRAEQLSHLLAQAGDNMFLAKQSDGKSDGFEKLGEKEEWLLESIEVFGGDLTCCRREHENMEMCDLQRLVVPMLGLWAQLCRTVRKAGASIPEADEESEARDIRFDDLTEIHSHISSRINTIFPERFSFNLKGGSEERVLFGNLVERLAERLEEEANAPQEAKSSHWSTLRIATKLRLPPSGGRRLSAALRDSRASG